MKTLFGATVGLGAIAAATSALAADLQMKKGPYTKAPPAVVATVYDWSGFYVGFNAGGGSSRDCWNLVQNANVVVNPALNREGCSGGGGAAVGGQVGYRYQMANWVFGVEAQGDWANFKGTNRNLILPNVSDRSRTNGFGLFTGQVGYAVNNVLLYAKGGAALTDNRYRTFFTPTGVLAGSASDTRWGGTIGAGIEVGFAPNWTAGVEYDHLFMQDKTYNLTTPTGALFSSIRDRQDVDLVTVRVNYKWGGPVVARY